MAIDFITNNICQVSFNSEILFRYCIVHENENLNLFKILVNLFLEVDCENMEGVIQELLENLINNIDSNRSDFEYIYQKIASYYRDKTKPLTKEKILKFTNLLRVLLTINITFNSHLKLNN